MTSAALGWPARVAAPAPAPKGRKKMPKYDDLLAWLGGSAGISTLLGYGWGSWRGRKKERVDLASSSVDVAQKVLGMVQKQLDEQTATVQALQARLDEQDVEIVGLVTAQDALRKDRDRDRAALDLLRGWAIEAVNIAARNAAELVRRGGEPEALPDLPPDTRSGTAVTTLTQTTKTTTTQIDLTRTGTTRPPEA